MSLIESEDSDITLQICKITLIILTWIIEIFLFIKTKKIITEIKNPKLR